MTNQLLLAQVLAEGFNGDYLWHWTHDSDAWKAVVPASATVIASLIAIIGVWLTARKATQQMEFSKQGTPPELTRYKEWLEVSEKYKDLVDSTNVHVLGKSFAEYQEIESSRQAALKRAVWERKVISACPDIRVQKRILSIPYAMLVGKKIDFFALWPWLKSKSVKVLERIFGVLLGLLFFVIIIEYLQSSIGERNFFVDAALFLISAYIMGALLAIYEADSREIDTEYYCIQIRIAEGVAEEDELTKSFSKYAANRRRVRSSLLKNEYREWIYYPGFSLQRNPILRFAIPVILYVYYFFPFYWFWCLISWAKYGEWELYGTYRPGAFGLDEKEKSKRFSWAKLLKSIKELEFNDKKVCVLWLIMVAAVIAIGTLTGGKQIINILVFNIGYVISFFLISMNEKVLNKLSDGPSSEFQKKVSSCVVILLFVLMALLGSLFFATENWRLIWLGALMVGTLYFFPYYFVHGKSMIYLGLICAINIFVGYVCTDISLEVIAYIDTAIKFMFGIYLLFLSKPSKQV